MPFGNTFSGLVHGNGDLLADLFYRNLKCEFACIIVIDHCLDSCSLFFLFRSILRDQSDLIVNSAYRSCQDSNAEGTVCKAVCAFINSNACSAFNGAEHSKVTGNQCGIYGIIYIGSCGLYSRSFCRLSLSGLLC